MHSVRYPSLFLSLPSLSLTPSGVNRYGFLDRIIPGSYRSGTDPGKHDYDNKLDDIVYHERCTVGVVSCASGDLGWGEVEVMGEREEGEGGDRERGG